MISAAREFESNESLVDYYNQRFADGYMNDWDDVVREKISAFLRDTKIPNASCALDFGCGQGALTSLLKACFPTCRVQGCDVSPVAIDVAKNKNRDLCFFEWKQDSVSEAYDLIFSHHVLEHVLDLDQTLDELDAITTPTGLHVHILPCGNEESLEWRLARQTESGFQKNGRFFFEEDGHLRRLTSAQLQEMYRRRGYHLQRMCFANQHYGTFHWMIGLGPDFIREHVDPGKGHSVISSIWLQYFRARLLLLWRAKCLAGNRPVNRLKRLLYPAVGPLARGYLEQFQKNFLREIRTRKSDPRGSEMLVCFARDK